MNSTFKRGRASLACDLKRAALRNLRSALMSDQNNLKIATGLTATILWLIVCRWGTVSATCHHDAHIVSKRIGRCACTSMVCVSFPWAQKHCAHKKQNKHQHTHTHTYSHTSVILCAPRFSTKTPVPMVWPSHPSRFQSLRPYPKK